MNIFVISIAVVLGAIPLQSQMHRISAPNVTTEGTLYEEGGVVYTDAVAVKFKENVFPLYNGQRIAKHEMLGEKYKQLRTILSKFDSGNGIVIHKQISSATWRRGRSMLLHP